MNSSPSISTFSHFSISKSFADTRAVPSREPDSEIAENGRLDYFFNPSWNTLIHFLLDFLSLHSPVVGKVKENRIQYISRSAWGNRCWNGRKDKIPWYGRLLLPFLYSTSEKWDWNRPYSISSSSTSSSKEICSQRKDCRKDTLRCERIQTLRSIKLESVFFFFLPFMVLVRP